MSESFLVIMQTVSVFLVLAAIILPLTHVVVWAAGRLKKPVLASAAQIPNELEISPRRAALYFENLDDLLARNRVALRSSKRKLGEKKNPEVPRVFKVNDVEFELVLCGHKHCGQIPTENDALLAFAAWEKEWGRMTCPICGELVNISRFHILHQEDGSWRAEPGRERRIGIRIEGNRLGPAASTHKDCLLRALPHGGKELIETAESFYRPYRP